MTELNQTAIIWKLLLITIKLTICQWSMDANLHIMLPLPRPHSSLHHIDPSFYCQKMFTVKCLLSVLLFSFVSVYSHEYKRGKSLRFFNFVRCHQAPSSLLQKHTKVTHPVATCCFWGSRAGLHLSAAVLCYTGLGVIWNCTFKEEWIYDAKKIKNCMDESFFMLNWNYSVPTTVSPKLSMFYYLTTKE